MTKDRKPFQRLPTNIKPFHYIIELKPDLTSFINEGKEDIYIEVFESTELVILNSCEITIKSAFYKENEKVVQSQAIRMDEENETVTITFPEKLPVGRSGFLHIDFQGIINDKLRGLYRSKYTNSNEKYAAVTQFEATDARRCFPCWDEPALKSTFDMALIVPEDLVALSNMPVKSTSSAVPGYKYVEFDRTPVMSTYLVAIAVGEFDYVEDCTRDGILVRVYTPRGKQEQGRFALEVATKVLPYYNSYFSIPYLLPKMDLIAVADFNSGAMENWGLVTYRESCLLVDPQNTAVLNKQWIALIVAHELAHQWFGNLVTMEWWTDLWLKEGYATFTEFLCVNVLFPEYAIWTQFVTETLSCALKLDALKNSHPIEVPVGHPSEINEIFDDISYDKGASVIRMLHAYVGEEDFRRGMSFYLSKHSYSNARTEDLWAALEETSKKPVRQVMSTWTKQQGFPLVKVSTQSCTASKRVLSFSQERFLADGSVDSGNTLWMIPITVSSSEDPEKTIKNEMMETKRKDIEFHGVSEHSWLMINPGRVGVFRTLYSNDLLEKFIPAIRDQTLPPLDRLGLLDDLSAVAQAGQVSAVQILQLVQAYELETSYTVWSTIVDNLNIIGTLISHLDIYANFQCYGRCVFKNIYSQLGWDARPNETHLDTLLRSLVLNRLVTYEDPDVLQEAVCRFEAHISQQSILPADLRSLVYRAVFLQGGVHMFETLLTLYRLTDLQEEKRRILGSLGATKDEDLINRILEFAMSEEVKSQDVVFLLTTLTMPYKGRALVWEFFKSNYEALMRRFPNGWLLTRLVKSVTERFVTEAYAVEIEDFFEKHPCPSAARNVQQSIETIRLNAAWLHRDVDAIAMFLQSF